MPLFTSDGPGLKNSVLFTSLTQPSSQDCSLIRLHSKLDVFLSAPALQTGTHFLLTLETIVFLFHLLGATSKPFSSLSTGLAHAARLGFFLQKRAIINSLLLLLLIVRTGFFLMSHA